MYNPKEKAMEKLNMRTIIVGNRLILREMAPEDFAALSEVNTFTRVYAITKSEWLRQKSGNR